MNVIIKSEYSNKQKELIRKKQGQALKKYELALLYGVSCRTLSRMLNEIYYDEIRPKGYKKNSVYVSPEIVAEFIYNWNNSSTEF